MSFLDEYGRVVIFVNRLTTLSMSRKQYVGWHADWWAGKEMEGSGHGLTGVFLLLLYDSTESLRNFEAVWSTASHHNSPILMNQFRVLFLFPSNPYFIFWVKDTILLIASSKFYYLIFLSSSSVSVSSRDPQIHRLLIILDFSSSAGSFS
jgi:hypothetical protein